LALVPAFFGVGFAWPAAAEWSGELDRLLGPFDRNPWLERLEAHRVYNLARSYRESMMLQDEIDRLRGINQHKAEMLEQLSESRAFKLGDRIAQLRNRNGASWREQLRALIRER
jgi:hypothetical protein